MAKASAVPAAFKKGDKVKFAIAFNNGKQQGFVKGTGTIKALVPKDAIKGARRLTVVDAKNKVFKPFLKQCKPA
jgi:hypothetical protein